MRWAGPRRKMVLMTNKPARRAPSRALAEPRAINVADAKRHFSEILVRVADGHETVLITRRGRPMARLMPVEVEAEPSPLGKSRGWLEDDDPFFATIDAIVEARAQHRPRAVRPTKPHGARARR